MLLTTLWWTIQQAMLNPIDIEEVLEELNEVKLSKSMIFLDIPHNLPIKEISNK